MTASGTPRTWSLIARARRRLEKSFVLEEEMSEEKLRALRAIRGISRVPR
jgi:hypothetical protein